MDETMRALIAGVSAGAAAGAEELRRAGVALELDVFSVEARIDPVAPTASIRVDFVMGGPPPA